MTECDASITGESLFYYTTGCVRSILKRQERGKKRVKNVTHRSYSLGAVHMPQHFNIKILNKVN